MKKGRLEIVNEFAYEKTEANEHSFILPSKYQRDLINRFQNVHKNLPDCLGCFREVYRNFILTRSPPQLFMAIPAAENCAMEKENKKQNGKKNDERKHKVNNQPTTASHCTLKKL